MTSLAEEAEEQKRWTARLRRSVTGYDALVANEFSPPEEQRARVAEQLSGLFDFAAHNVPYYRELFAARGVDARDTNPLAVLRTLPVLRKLDLLDNEEKLRTTAYPPGDGEWVWTQSSGTTGRPARVLHSKRSNWMFTYLRQRAYRWFRFDLEGTLAEMRLPSHLPAKPDGGELGLKETLRLEGWPYIDRHFATGPFCGYSVLNPVEDRIAWLKRENPNYLIAYSETLEQLAFAVEGDPPAPALKGTFAISEQLTPGMAAHIERSLGAPVRQNYGLNEIGLVAARCEAGRYHVHTEHCFVEIVDDNDEPVAAGKSGRLLVTGLRNSAMPLIRYDTGDMATAVQGACACGRTLPAFENIAGRYSRIRFLPDGTLGLVGTLRDAIEEMPREAVRGLREFQIHQFRNQRFELRIVSLSGLTDAFQARLREVWTNAARPPGAELTILRVDALSRPAGGKTQVFTSDFMPPPAS